MFHIRSLTGRVVSAALALAASLIVLSVQSVGHAQIVAPGTRVVTGAGPGGFDGGLQVETAGSPRTTRTITPQANPQATNARYIPGEVIVKFLGSSPPTSVQRDAVRALGARTVVTMPFGDAVVLKLEAGRDVEAVASQMRTRSDVEYAQPNYLRQALFTPDDPLFTLQWNLQLMGMERAWDINPAAGEAVTVAVIDSGLALRDTRITFTAEEFSLGGSSFPALGTVTVPFAAAFDIVSPDRIVAPFDFVWMDDVPVDMSGHGTHVTGSLGQLTDNAEGAAGVAFNVRIMPLKVLADEWDFIFGAVPVCCGASDATVSAAIRYAVESGADVINMSLGGPDPSPVIDDAMRFAVGEGLFIAIAGGNSFNEGNPRIWPAATAESIDGAMSVAAVDRQSRRAFYSNTGSYIEIAAPGGDQRTDEFDGVVQQTLDRDFAFTFSLPSAQFGPPRFDVLSYVFFQGTSMASPHVAGLAALLISQGVTDPAAVEAGIKATATDLGEPGDDVDFGAGLANAAAAVRGLGLAVGARREALTRPRQGDEDTREHRIGAANCQALADERQAREACLHTKSDRSSPAGVILRCAWPGARRVPATPH